MTTTAAWAPSPTHGRVREGLESYWLRNLDRVGSIPGSSRVLGKILAMTKSEVAELIDRFIDQVRAFLELHNLVKSAQPFDPDEAIKAKQVLEQLETTGGDLSKDQERILGELAHIDKKTAEARASLHGSGRQLAKCLTATGEDTILLLKLLAELEYDGGGPDEARPIWKKLRTRLEQLALRLRAGPAQGDPDKYALSQGPLLGVPDESSITGIYSAPSGRETWVEVNRQVIQRMEDENGLDLTKLPKNEDDWRKLQTVFQGEFDSRTQEDLLFCLLFWRTAMGLYTCGLMIHPPISERDSSRSKRDPEYRIWKLIQYCLGKAIDVLCEGAEVRGLDSAKIIRAKDVFLNYMKDAGERLWAEIFRLLGPQETPSTFDPLDFLTALDQVANRSFLDCFSAERGPREKERMDYENGNNELIRLKTKLRAERTKSENSMLPQQPTGSSSDVPQSNMKRTGQGNLVFISYSHHDKMFLDKLLTHLKPLVRSKQVSAWSDKDIQPGSKSLKEIASAIASSRVAFLLVTSSFLASDFIHEHELAPLLKAAEDRGVRILWALVRACNYKDSPIGRIQAAFPPDKPLAEMKAERDGAWVKICEVIKGALK